MTRRTRKLIAGMFIGFMAAVALASVFLWWQGDMWAWGAMPTHGMAAVSAAAFVAVLAVIAMGVVRGTRSDHD